MVDIKEYFRIDDYTIKDGLISTNDDVELIKKVKELPVQFGYVGGYFYCYDNQLTSLEGSPESVGDDFYCSENQLTSLVGCPNEVGGGFVCRDNQLTSLEGSPQSVGNGFYCHNNQLTSLDGAPESVDGDFDCRNNLLTSLAGSPQSVGGSFNCSNNKLTSLEGAPKFVGGYFYCGWSENLPLLRLVRYKKVQTYSRVNEIIRKYSYHKPLKEAILLCQKELIDNGFVGNAAW
jgi:hypothetical protein